ncbi:group III truncated hemoglobin [Deinococcus sp. Marseille-Q6407]|uniref:group III truncated hemoglobin n=1 Tax=Deinococcus sp. Marseille-Q6407 TaxID=2969223 RepID=UPI0021C1504D|nr:group III truncated hemoglobin [Deinococcus sp. Marseille-Q6407]
MTVPIPLEGGGQPTLFERIGAQPLQALLWDFYARVCQDPELGPVFRDRLGPFPQAGWPLHLARVEGFWRSVTRGPGAYRGQPGQAHLNLGIQPHHFDRWLALWEETLPGYMGEAEALSLLSTARRMRPTLERFAVHGQAPDGPRRLETKNPETKNPETRRPEKGGQ